MASAMMGGTRGQIERLLAAGGVAGLDDGRLLERFADGGDEAAFAALVARHGPLVLGTCRAVLRDPHDAEDAFQATFLVLARKAGTVRVADGGSLGGWLYRVASRVASQARADRLRRRGREVPTPDPSRAAAAAAGIDRAGPWDDWLPTLHEEIARLPERQRAPIVLCDLQGLTYDQAARQLRWTPPTLRCRLAAARARLRARLTRRGLTATGAVAALNAGRISDAATPAVPESWARAAVRAASGGATPAAVALGRHLLRAALLTRLSWLAAALLAAGASAFVASGLAVGPDDGANRQGPPPAAAPPSGPKPAPIPAPEAAEEDMDTKPVTISGRVFDPDGKPLPRATIYVRNNQRYERPDQGGRAVERAAEAGPDGRFRIDLDPSKNDSRTGDRPAWHRAMIGATAPGYGPAWIDAEAAARGGAELRLVRDDLPIRGRILDGQGRPAVGVEVRVWGIARTRDGVDPDALIASGALDHDGIQVPTIRSPSWSFPTWIGRDGAVTTGDDGRFEITGVGRDRVALLTIVGEGLEQSRVAVLDRMARVPDGTRLQFPSASGPFWDDIKMTLYGAEFTHVVGPSKPIVGVVRLKGTGRPAAGVTVVGQIPGKANKSKVWSVVMTTTDERGHYRLEGLPKAGSYLVDVRTAPGLPHLAIPPLTVADTEGLKPIEMNFDLPRGVAVRGRVLDAKTRRAVPCEWVHYAPLPDDPDKQNASGFTPDAGRGFRITVPPGKGMIAVKVGGEASPYPGARLDPADRGKLEVQEEDGTGFGFSLPVYNAYRFVEIPDDAESFALDLEVSPGVTIGGELTGPDGRPVAGAKAMGLTSDPFAARAIEGAAFEVAGLRADSSRLVEFRHEGLGLAGSATVSGSDAAGRPRVVTLVPCGTLAGRLLDEDGRPLRGARVSARIPRRYGPSDPAFRPREAVTDRDGRFRIPGVNPTLGASVWIADPGHPAPKYRSKPDRDLGKLTVPAGDVLDLGDVRIHAVEER